MRRGAALPLLLAAAACTPAIRGEVRDATSGRPVAGADVAVTSSGWGVRDGQLVWDKDYSHSAQSGADGRFRIEGISGGHRLDVRAAGYAPVSTSLCSRSPMLVRIGGPYERLAVDRQLRIGEAAGWRFGTPASLVPADQADLSLVGATVDQSRVRLRAPLGLAFATGTGNPPPAPQAYSPELAVDLLDCGWLFVRSPAGLAIVRTGSMAIDLPREGGRFLMLSFGMEPARL